MKSFKLFVLLLGITLSFTQCIDKEFDSPPIDGSPTVDVPEEAIITIDKMMEQFTLGTPVALDAGSYLKGVVVGSDKSGNIYKTLVVQDETAGIAIIIDDTDLFDTYFVGREVYIKLDNLYLGDFSNLPQIGMAPSGGEVSRIPAALVPDIILPAAYNVSVTPTPLLLGQLNDAALNTLIQIDNVEFASFELGETYATAIPAQDIFQSENRAIVNCDGFSVNMRTSGFSDFANTEVAGGNGTLYGILSKFGSDSDAYQILIRDLGDVNFNSNRCDGSGGGGGTDPVDIDDADVISINSMLSTFNVGSSVALTPGKYFKGTVTADDRSGNFYKQLFIEDDSDAILISLDGFDLYNDYPVGSEVYLKLDGLHIGDFAGLPQIGVNPSGGEVSRIPEGQIPSTLINANTTQSVVPRDIQFSDINDDLLNHLVRVSEVQVVDGSVGDTYADSSGPTSLNHTIEGCDGDNIIMRSSGFSDFADATLPDGNGELTAILTKFNDTYQLVIRDLGDVSMTGMRCDGSGGGGGGGDEGTVDEDFESGNNNDQVSLTGWDNVATQGERTWQFKEFDNNVYAQATAFNDEAPNMETYLITPEIDFDEVTMFSFRTAQAFYTHGGLEVLYSSNFSGNADSATWETIDAVLADGSNDQYEWVNSGDIDVSNYSGAGHIAFKYTGSGPSGDTNSYLLDDILVK